MDSNEINQSKNIYDIMAVAYKKITPYEHWRIQLEDTTESNQSIYNTVAIFKEELRSSKLKAFANFKKRIIDLYPKDRELEYGFCYHLIEALDNYTEYNYKKTSQFCSKFNSISSLNNNNDTGIYVFAKMKNTIINLLSENITKYELKKNPRSRKHGLRKREDYDASGINRILKNYIIIDKSDMDNFKVKIHEITDNENIYNKIVVRGKVRIAIVPFCDRNLDNILKIKMNNNGFWIEGSNDEYKSELVEQFKNQLTNLINKDLDFIIFPEMFFLREMFDVFRECIDKFEKCSDTKIILAGSMWENYTNICHVFDEKGKMIYKQNKHSSFEYEEKFEILRPSDNIIHIIDIDGIGRIFTFICKDLGNPKLMKIPEIFGADMILFPAFSPSLNIDTPGKNITTQFNCITVFANACAAFCINEDRVNQDIKVKKKEIGFATVPAKNGTKSHCNAQYYTFNDNCLNCFGVCSPRILNISLGEIYEENKITSCKVFYTNEL